MHTKICSAPLSVKRKFISAYFASNTSKTAHTYKTTTNASISNTTTQSATSAQKTSLKMFSTPGILSKRQKREGKTSLRQ